MGQMQHFTIGLKAQVIMIFDASAECTLKSNRQGERVDQNDVQEWISLNKWHESQIKGCTWSRFEYNNISLTWGYFKTGSCNHYCSGKCYSGPDTTVWFLWARIC